MDTRPDSSSGPPAAHGDYILIAGHGQLITHFIEKDEITIGRDPACDVTIDHSTLSRRHAVLRLGPPLTIQDLGSTNGVRVSRKTTIGGDPVTLEAGETFTIGGFSFSVVSQRVPSSSTANRSGRDRLRVDDPTRSGVPPFIHDVARSAASVVILGESGVGKEVLAETLHVLSGRRGTLARINCAAMAESLIESELFGYEKGAFTGATAPKMGLLESAQGGTVFLDEIGELPPAMQAKLLRALESREVLRVGAIRPTKIDVRFISATNRDLPQEVAAKRFRHDLYFRLDGITLVISPLRERKMKIPELAARFLGGAAIEPDVLPALQAYDWPGNVRELKAVIERGLLLARGKDLGARHLKRVVDDLPLRETARSGDGEDSTLHDPGHGPSLALVRCMKRSLVLLLLAACGAKDETPSTSSAASGSGSAPAPVVAKPEVDRSPYCGAKPCPCVEGTVQKPGEWDHECVLAAPLVVQGVPCAPGNLTFYPDGKVKQCEQGPTPYVIDGIECGGNWHISFHPNGKLARCAGITPTTIGAYHASGPNLALFSDGTFADGEIAGEVDVGGVPCKDKVTLYKGGKLQSCWLGKPFTRGVANMIANDSITLRPDGTLKSAYFNRKGATIDGKPVPPSNTVCFDAAEHPLEKAPSDCNDAVGEMD